jgi:hypothetical protein
VGPLVAPRAAEMAAVLACGPGACLSHGSAASAWGLSATRGDVAPWDVTVPGGDRGHRPGIRIHRVRWLVEDERVHMDGLPLTSPARTLIDLASLMSSRDLEQVIARGERSGLVTRAGLASVLRRHAGRPGIPALRALLHTEHAPMLTRSEAEDRFLELIRKARLPVPGTNVMVGPYEIDFLWRSEGIAVEVDGFRFHASRSSFERDRRRDAELAARGIPRRPAHLAADRRRWRGDGGPDRPGLARSSPDPVRAPTVRPRLTAAPAPSCWAPVHTVHGHVRTPVRPLSGR